MTLPTCCEFHGVSCSQGRTCPERIQRAEEALRNNVRCYPRTADAAFRTPRYASAFEPHIAPPLWTRVVLFLRRFT